MKTISLFLGLVVGSVALTGCSMKGHHSKVNQSVVKLAAKSGSNVSGTLYLEDHHSGVIVSGKISGLTPGKHGFHIHEKGDCKGKSAKAAGDHFKLADQTHGDPTSKGAHAGDLGNIEAGKDGSVELNIFVKGVTLGKGEHSIAGRALVVHADADDLTSQPAGNSGKRIACGVIEVSCCTSCPDCKTDCKSCCKDSCHSCEKCKDNCKLGGRSDCKDGKKDGGCYSKKKAAH